MTKGKFNPRLDVKVTVGEVEIVLRYTLRALAIMQERLGTDGFNRLLQGEQASLGDIAVLDVILEAGMTYHHGEPKDHGLDVLAEATGVDLDELVEGFGKAFTLAFPAKTAAAQEGGDTGPPKPASTSTS